MKKTVIVILFLFVSSLGAARVVGNYYGQTIIQPFGYMAPRPPATTRTVAIDDIKFGFSAQQVCGYTDWSTATIHLPKQLLSKEYWSKIGNNLKQQAV